MPDALERILILEDRARHRSEQLDAIDSRLHKLERTVWIGVGVLGVLQFLVPLLLEKVR